MTYEKAIEQLHIISIIEGTLTMIRPKDAEAARMGMEALKKQSELEDYRTPKKVVPTDDSYKLLYRCPTCGETHLRTTKPDFCMYCGQALDWSEVGRRWKND